MSNTDNTNNTVKPGEINTPATTYLWVNKPIVEEALKISAGNLADLIAEHNRTSDPTSRAAQRNYWGLQNDLKVIERAQRELNPPTSESSNAVPPASPGSGYEAAIKEIHQELKGRYDVAVAALALTPRYVGKDAQEAQKNDLAVATLQGRKEQAQETLSKFETILKEAGICLS